MSEKYFAASPPGNADLAYAESHGGRCPFCQSDQEALTEATRMPLSLVVECDSCGKEWLECYQITVFLVTKDDAELLRRSELGLPPYGVAVGPAWSMAPDWAKYAMMDSDGSWYFAECRPMDDKENPKTWTVAGRHQRAMTVPVSDWRSSVHERPLEDEAVFDG